MSLPSGAPHKLNFDNHRGGDKDSEGLIESAAAVKNKKKKEKDRAKKAASTAVEEKQEEMNKEKTIASDKKVPKHVLAIREKLAKIKEAEERMKREEEEKLKKEEEERCRLKELERIAEEEKRLKKERKKEKLLKRKMEGLPLTRKQKEEARRMESMRNQIFANAAGMPPPSEASAKRPIYHTRRLPSSSRVKSETLVEDDKTGEFKEQETSSEVYPILAETVEQVVVLDAGKAHEVDIGENNPCCDEEGSDDDEWDSKSLDEADLLLPSTFAGEEVDSLPETLVQKDVYGAKDPLMATKPGDVVNQCKTQENIHRQESPEEPETSHSQVEKNLRSPICCIMGHVDSGKTKLLDCVRGTNVQEGEAGGITQQIGATYFPADNIRDRTRELKSDAKLNVPGLLVIDTPGHESFANLRSRGSSLCDIAILVVDIMEGLKAQTIESLNLLKMRNTKFIVALNKVDRLYRWKRCQNAPIAKAMNKQSKDVKDEFNWRLSQVITQFKEQGINTELYHRNRDMQETFSIVPTSAISGEGIPDLLLLLVQWSQKTMVEKLTYRNTVQCTVLEVKVVEGHGTTIDVVLVNGVLHEGDQIVVCSIQGPIVTCIRALLTPHPMKELRVKGTYLHHKEVKAAQGIKITAQGLEHTIAGTELYVVGPNDDLQYIKDAAMEDTRSVMNKIQTTEKGVYVQASTLGSLEALLECLNTSVVKIPVSGIGLGPVYKKDVIKASAMLEKKKEYAAILAFDVRVTSEARELAGELGVTIFCADIIYHLFDQFKAYINDFKERKKKETVEDVVFPCVLKIMPNCVFHKKDPIVLGVAVLEGIAKIGTPLCIRQKDFSDVGRIASIQISGNPVDHASQGQEVSIKIVGDNHGQCKEFGRDFGLEDKLVSHITRKSIDVLESLYEEDMSAELWNLVEKLKRYFKI
ncbi:OLC1v1025109C1 [Oldenlandia corymbosa var. corymbosa]|uniref:Eukaryotic translation initiation factor 5B n=1 Tax=Oldenlandia corymbosa var. corymbosa TaxID=529605 RepID=A0AAV1C4M3_OLDCO|nr:OLC1v1025109C1 [Oldenlandia corymbosa var. corymbosa]